MYGVHAYTKPDVTKGTCTYIHKHQSTSLPYTYVDSIEATKWITVIYIQELSHTHVDIHYIIANDSTAQGLQLLPPLTDE